jgi:GTP-binding protein HflX
MSKMPDSDVLFMSATERLALDQFRETLYQRVREIHVTRFPYNDFLYDDFSEEFQQD